MQEEEEGCGTTSTAQYYSRYILGSISRTIECVGAKTFSFVVCLVVAYGKAKRMSEMRLKCTSKTKPSLIPRPSLYLPPLPR